MSRRRGCPPTSLVSVFSSWKIPRGADRAVDSRQGSSGSFPLAGVLVERSTLGGRGFRFGEEVADGNVEGVGYVDKSFVEDPAFAVFDVYEHVPSNPGSQCQRFLGHALFGAECPDVGANCGSPPLPVGDALGTVLAGARRHASK